MIEPFVKAPEWSVVDKGRFFTGVSFNISHNEGWAVGAGIIFHYKNGQWERDKQGSSLFGANSLYSVAVQADGSAWAVGVGIIIHYKNGQWEKDKQGSGLLMESSLNSIAVQPDGSAWAVGKDFIFRYKNGTWEKDQQGSDLLMGGSLSSVAVQADGSAWAVGGATIIHYKNGQWERDQQGSSLLMGGGLYSVAVQADGSLWAVGTGIILHHKNGQWEKDQQGSGVLGTEFLFSVAVQADGSLWAVGRKVILHYKNGQWEKDQQGSGLLMGGDLFSVAVQADGSAWAVGTEIIFHYKNGQWEKDQQGSSLLMGGGLYSVAVQADGSLWALGYKKIFHYKNGQWEKDQQGSSLLMGGDLFSVAVQADGSAWAVGSGIIFHYKNGQWEKDQQGSRLSGGNYFNSVAVQADGSAWAVGSGTILHYKNGTWEKDQQGSGLLGTLFLHSVAVQADGSAWAVGDGIILHYYKNGQWEKDQQGSGLLMGVGLSSVAVQADGSAWAVGTGIILHYKNGRWEKDRQGSSLLGTRSNPLRSVAAQADGSLWAVGYENILCYKNGQWEKDQQGSGLLGTAFQLSSVAVQTDGSALAVGYGIILKLILKKSIKIKEVPSDDAIKLYSLQDSIRFKFSQPAYHLQFSMGPADDTTTNYLNGIANAYSSRYNNDSTITVKFSKDAKKALEPLKGKDAIFRLRVKVHPSLDIWQEFDSNTFLGGKMPLGEQVLQTALITGFSLIFLNIVLLLLAVPFPWFRENVFGSNIDTLLSLFSIKGLITKPLLTWIAPLKLAMLADYRKELADKPDLKQWKNKSYNPPQIGNTIEENSIDNLWRDISLKTEKDVKNHLWLIEGRSGLGKTALLEQLTLKILNAGKTAIFLKLSLFQEAGKALQTEFEYYGRLVVDPETAKDIVKSGGFYVLLDGLNEARDQEAVRTFVKLILRGNTVIITSQFAPDWGEIVKDKIDLRPFGKQQLRFLLQNEDWVEKVTRADYLFDIYDTSGSTASNDTDELRLLPFTATLIAEFLKKNDGTIPITRLQIYRELFKELKEDQQYINLEKKAWGMFCDNSQNLKPDVEEDGLDLQFLKKAREQEVMTAFVVKQETFFRFRHERIFRFVVTSFLYRQHETLKLEELDKQLTKGQDKMYWSDVIEFCGEFLSEDAILSTAAVVKYKDFLIEVATFEPLILKKRLIYQWKRLSDKKPEIKDAAFDAKLLLLLAMEGKEI